MMWTQEEDQLVLAQDMPDSEIAKAVGRSKLAVGKRRFDLRHRYPDRRYGSKPQRAWTEAELELVQDFSLSAAEVAKETGRTVGAVYHRRGLLRKEATQTAPTKTGKWSEAEIKLIMSSVLSDDELSEILDRSKGAIAAKRYHLRHGNHGSVKVV